MNCGGWTDSWEFDISEPASMYSNGADITSPTITAITILIRLVTRGEITIGSPDSTSRGG